MTGRRLTGQQADHIARLMHRTADRRFYMGLKYAFSDVIIL